MQKAFPNGFQQTDLEQRLRDGDASQLLLCGMMTSMCVDATVRAAVDLGFECTVVHDACATKDLTFDGRRWRPPTCTRRSWRRSVTDTRR